MRAWMNWWTDLKSVTCSQFEVDCFSTDASPVDSPALHCFFFCFVFHLERSHCFREGNILCIRRKSRWKKNTCRLQSVRNSASSKKKKKKAFLCQTAALVTVIMPFGETVFASASTFISPLGVDSGDKSRWTRGFLLLYLYIRWCFCQCGVYLRAPEGS